MKQSAALSTQALCPHAPQAQSQPPARTPLTCRVPSKTGAELMALNAAWRTSHQDIMLCIEEHEKPFLHAALPAASLERGFCQGALSGSFRLFFLPEGALPGKLAASFVF